MEGGSSLGRVVRRGCLGRGSEKKMEIEGK